MYRSSFYLRIKRLNNSRRCSLAFSKRINKHKMPPTHKIQPVPVQTCKIFFLCVQRVYYKKIKLKRNQCSGDSVCRPMGCARAGRCCDPRRAHTRAQFKYTTIEHVHSKGMNIRCHRRAERDGAYFLSRCIDSRLPHIRNRVTQRLIWLLKIEGLLVGMLSAPRFPGLLAHWAFFRRCEIRNRDRWRAGIVRFLLC